MISDKINTGRRDDREKHWEPIIRSKATPREWCEKKTTCSPSMFHPLHAPVNTLVGRKANLTGNERRKSGTRCERRPTHYSAKTLHNQTR